MPGLRSLRNRLAVIFALIILGAIGTIYLSVTPRLEASLTAQTLDQVRATSAQRTPEIAAVLLSGARVLPRGRDPEDRRRPIDEARVRDERERARDGSPSGSAPR